MTLSQADIDSLLGPQPADGVESLLDAPVTGEDISLALQDPDFVPTQEQFGLFREYNRTKQTDWINTIAQSVDVAAQMIGNAAAEGVQGAAANPLNYVEGLAQGTRQLYGLVSQSENPDSPLFRFKDLVTGTGTPESQYAQFLEARDFAKRTRQLESGEDNLWVPSEFTNPEFVTGVSMIADPTLFIPGIGEALGAGKFASKAVGKAAQITGRGIAAAARPLERAAAGAERLVGGALNIPAETIRNTATTAGIAGALGVAPEAAVVAGIPTAVSATREVGEAIAAAGENLMTQPSRIGPLEAIGNAPGANMRQRMLGVIGQYGGDAALDTALRATAGGLEGAAIGAGLGFLAGGEEGAAAGIGMGGTLGVTGATAARTVSRLTGSAAREARAGDLQRYMDSLPEGESKRMFTEILDRNGVDIASSMMDLDGLIRGRFGDVDIQYRSNKDFSDRFGGGRGVQLEEAGRPVIYINADILGKGKGDGPLYTLGHELFHALEKSEQLGPKATDIKDALVGRWIAEGDTVRKLADGALTEAEIEARFAEYRDKLGRNAPDRADALAQYDTVEKRAGYVASEIAAEHLARLVSGQTPDTMLRGFGGLSRQLLDMALTQNASRALSRMAEGIETRFGAKPLDSVLFPDLREASPQVNAMLRDLLRSRRRLDERILMDSDGPGTVLRPQDAANPVAAKTLVDIGLAERMPDGTVRTFSDEEMRVREDADTQAIRTILEGIPGARSVDGNISGRFSPEQLSAIEQSQAVSGRMKDKIRAIDSAMRNGNSIFVDYGAATRRKLNKQTGKYTSKYSSGIRLSQREVLPYSFYLSKADNPVMRVIDITKIRKSLERLTAPDGSIAGGLWDNVDGFMSDLAGYFTNLDAKESARRSAELFGEDKARFLGDFVNEQEKGGRKFVRDLRVDRVGSIDPREFRARISEDAIQMSKLRWMPSERVGDTTVTSSEEGYRIIGGAKQKLYGPDGKLLGIFDTQTQAERKADATQARLQPEDRQQQRPARDEGRQTPEAGRGDRAVGRREGQAEVGAVRQEGDVRSMPMSDLERSDMDLRISTRNPSAKKATENPISQQLSIDLESITRTPGALQDMIQTVGKYPGVRFRSTGQMNRAKEFIRFVADNLIYLHDSVVTDVRNRSKLWYDGARKLAEDWSVRFNVPREGVAGVIASLSPQKDWYQNVTLAERVFETVRDRQSEPFSGNIEQWARTKMTSGQNPKRLIQDKVIDGMAGKRFSELSDYEKAVFVRAFDEVNNTRTYPIVSPEGKMLDIARKADGTPATYAWGDFNSIAKAVRIAENPTKQNISDSLGYEHKVRSFYDNILLPNNPEHGDVTIDTHAVAAALMLPLAGSDTYVAHNFGQGVPGSSVYGTSGTYGIYADAYRLAAKERGLLPREMQSITWEAIRGLFTPEFKTAANKKLVESIWKEYKSGKATIDETRQRIVDSAGGIRNPSWYGSGGAAASETGVAAEPRQLPVAGDLGRSGANARGGSPVPGVRSQEVASQRFMPSAAEMATGRPVPSHREAQALFDRGFRIYGAPYDGAESPILLTKAAQITQYDPENLWAVPPRGKGTPEGMRNMPSDTDYLAAVQNGDTAAAQRMVEEAAKAAGAINDGKPLYHGGNKVKTSFARGSFRAGTGSVYLTDNKRVAWKYALGGGVDRDMSLADYRREQLRRLPTRQPTVQALTVIGDVANFSSRSDRPTPEKLLEIFGEEKMSDVLSDWSSKHRDAIESGDPIESVLNEALSEGGFIQEETDATRNVPELQFLAANNLLDPYMQAINKNVIAYDDAEAGGTTYVVLDPKRVKSADPVTRDDAGNVIPLSQRFKTDSEDIRYMPASIQREVGRNIDFANPPTEEKAKAALSSAKQPFWRKHESLPEGSPVGVRIDIPAFLNRGTYVQTIHEPATPGNVGDRIGYDTSVRLSGPVRFFVKEGSEESKLGAVAIKEGRAAKHPIATVEGRLIKDRSIPSNIETWTPVGMDPKKHSYFYDKRTDQPVTGGSESFSVGNTVFVKDPVYGRPEDFRYMPTPDSSMPGAYSFAGGFRAIPGKAQGSLRLYGPAGTLIGIASSLDEAQRIVRRKAEAR